MQRPDCTNTDASTAAPTSFLACLPFLWSRVLFPGSPGAPGPFRWWRLLILLVLPGLLLYPCLSFYLFEPDEGRYAEIPREMLARGEWIVPYLQGEPYLDKPPLLYWLVMLSYRVFGVHDWAARLIPALAMHLTVLGVYVLGRRRFTERVAFWGALLLSLTPGFIGVGRLLLMDGLLALWIAVSLLCGFEAVHGDGSRRRWWIASALACGLGVLTKGPVALLLVLPPLWLHRRLTGGGGLGWRAVAGFCAVTMTIALPWCVAVCLRLPEFGHHFLWQHNVVRFLTPFDHVEPVWYYAPILLLGLLPWTMHLPGLARFLGTGDETIRRARAPELGFLLLWASWCVLFFSLSGCKLATYVLPAFVPLALALGYFVVHTQRGRSFGTGALLGLALCIQFAGHYVVVPWYANYRSPLPHWHAVTRECAERDRPLVSYPRHPHSLAFYLGREDVRNFRSKQIDPLREELRRHPETVVLLTHRHSLQGLRQALPPDLRIIHAAHFGLTPPQALPDALGKKTVHWLGETALGICDLVIVERRN